MREPLVSIVILTYNNGLSDIRICLKSLEKIKYRNTQIILVDNASLDNTVSFVKTNFPKVKIIENKKNLGFCRGNNQAVKIARGKYILFLNNDTIVTPDFLAILVKELENDKSIGVVQPKIRQLKNKNKLDAGASYLTDTGFLYHYGYSQNEKDKKYNKELLMYSVKGACFLTRKILIDKIGLFDDDYFAYFEETDFCHRVWLSGYLVKYTPESEIYHLGGIGKKVSSTIEFHSYKNRIQTYLKNFEIVGLIQIIPIHILVCLIISLIYSFRFQFKSSFAIIMGVLWNFFNFNLIYRKRQKVQRLRKVKDSFYFPMIKKSVSISYFKHFFLSPRSYYDFKEI